MKEKTADIDILEDLLSTQKQYIEDKDYQKEHNIKEQAIDYAKMWTKATETLIAENKELKEKNKWKPIKEYNRQKYDWVLVKYFDGDYECVPEVAEQRIDGKWYTSEKQIPFEVKYFFDMQSLLGKE